MTIIQFIKSPHGWIEAFERKKEYTIFSTDQLAGFQYYHVPLRLISENSNEVIKEFIKQNQITRLLYYIHSPEYNDETIVNIIKKLNLDIECLCIINTFKDKRE